MNHNFSRESIKIEIRWIWGAAFSPVQILRERVGHGATKESVPTRLYATEVCARLAGFFTPGRVVGVLRILQVSQVGPRPPLLNDRGGANFP